eukprot:scaffold2801_cov266-Pinguiococcus_pyrenoidosus.AAC.3
MGRYKLICVLSLRSRMGSGAPSREDLEEGSPRRHDGRIPTLAAPDYTTSRPGLAPFPPCPPAPSVASALDRSSPRRDGSLRDVGGAASQRSA